MRNFLTEKLWIKSTILQKLHTPYKFQRPLRFARGGVTPDKVLFVPHHLSHAAAAFYPSPFSRAAFFTLDAVGEWSTSSWGVAKESRLFPIFEMRFPHSIGMWYSAFTAFLGFEVNDGEYKVMGMAGYGKPHYKDLVKKTIRQLSDGSIVLNLDYLEFHRSARRMYSKLFEETFSGIDQFDLTASLQSVAEEIILNMMNIIQKKTKETNLVYGGGVALNSVVNGKILRNTKFKDVFIFPAAGDDGGAVGAALYVYHHVLGNRKRKKLENVFLGPDYKNYNKYKNYKYYKEKELLDFVTDQLVKGKVIGWFEGRAEFGPRALGHRSILADPINPKMKDIVNEKVKFREQFRPFAPVVLEEQASKYFDRIPFHLARYMLATVAAKSSAKKIAPAVVHVDGTSRIQTVAKSYDGRFRSLLEVFYKKTKRPILLNTSFNLKGEPIVNSPADAYKTFMKSGLDVLVVENYVITK